MEKFDSSALKALAKRPPLSSRASDFWADPYVSSHVLNAHLDPDDDAGSRKPERIRAEASWIVDAWELDRFAAAAETEPPLVLDLGCGPGLYAAEFLERGCGVHGMDISPASIEHARRRQSRRRRGAGPKAVFEQADFTRQTYPAGAAGAAMVYGIFGNLSNAERDRALSRLASALRPGARFVFDVFTEAYARREALKESWCCVLKDGFWMSGPHLVLEKSWIYEADRTIFNAYYLLDSRGTLHTRLVRHRWYDAAELTAVLERRGFRPVLIAGDLTGAPMDDGGDWIAVAAEFAG